MQREHLTGVASPPPWLEILQALEHEHPGRHSYTLALLLEARGGPRLNAHQVQPWVEHLRRSPA